MKLPTSQLLEQGGASWPCPVVQIPFAVQTLVLRQTSQRRLMRRRITQRKKHKPPTLGKTKRGPTLMLRKFFFSFSQDISIPFGHICCQGCRLSQMVLLESYHWVWVESEKLIVFPVSHTKGLTNSKRISPWLQKTREFSFPKPQLTLTLEKRDKEFCFLRLPHHCILHVLTCNSPGLCNGTVRKILRFLCRAADQSLHRKVSAPYSIHLR